MIAKLLTISGHVQGVGYRDWLIDKANALGLSGWVRNRRDGSVETLIAGDVDAVEELARQCRRGPPMAEVSSITEEFTTPPPEPGFRRAPAV